MRKLTIILVVLASLAALIFVTTSGILSILGGLVAVGLGICVGCVQTAGLVDENYCWISEDHYFSMEQAVKPSQFMAETSLNEYPYKPLSTAHHSFSNTAQ